MIGEALEKRKSCFAKVTGDFTAIGVFLLAF